MKSLETTVQAIVQQLETGTASRIIRYLAAIAATVGIASIILFSEFRGLTTAEGMDQAQVAREIARGHGQTTQYIRPLQMAEISRNKGMATVGTLPDTYNAPLPVWINGLALAILRPANAITNSGVIYSPDRVIAGVSMVFLLLSAIVAYFTAAYLFDHHLGLVVAALMVVCGVYWEFTVSGLPQMFMLFFFNIAVYFMVRAADAHVTGGRVGLWLIPAGFAFGLLTLCHGLGIWIFAGAFLFSAIFFRPILLTSLLLLIGMGICVAPWLIQNYRVSGNPFGIAIYSTLDGFGIGETKLMRSLEPDVSRAGLRGALTKVKPGLTEVFDSIFRNLGWCVAAPFFFASLLHVFRNPGLSAMRWCVFLMWLAAAGGMTFYRQTNGVISSNQLHVLFLPIMAAYGLAFIYVMLNKVAISQKLVRWAATAVIFIFSAVPLALFLFTDNNKRVNWPPYAPPLINTLGQWTKPDEVLCSDMAWAVAWYADRRTLLLPQTPKDFSEISDFGRLGGPIVGLYLTPISGYARFIPDLIRGEYKDWSAFILRTNPNLSGFPLQKAVQLPIDNECIFYADRPRWEEQGAH